MSQLFQIPEVGSGTELARAATQAASSSSYAIVGAGEGGLAPFLVQFSREIGRPIAILVENQHRAERLARNLEYHWTALFGDDEGGKVLLIPSYDLGPYDEVAPDRTLVIQRTGALFKLMYSANWRFVILPADATLRRIVPRLPFEEMCLEIKTGTRLDREHLLTCLERGGYHRSPLVEEPGSYALRGSLIDLFPPFLPMPVRIDLWGEEIERIRIFDPESQATGAEIGQVWVHPARLALLPGSEMEQQEAAARLRDICDKVNHPTSQTERLIEDVLAGRVIVGFQGYTPAFHPNLDTIFDYFPEDVTLCLENPAALVQAWRREESSIERAYLGLRERGVPAFDPVCHAIPVSEVESFITSGPHIIAHPFAVTGEAELDLEQSEKATDLAAIPTSDLQERFLRLSPLSAAGEDLLGAFCGYLAELVTAGYRVTIVAHTKGQAERLVAMLRRRDLRAVLLPGLGGQERPGVYVDVGELEEGCLLPADGRAWIAEEEVFGRRARRRRHRPGKGRGISLDDLRMLEPDDLVVHAEHGIGQYRGLKRRKVRKSEMDFLLIEYRDGDKLYLPVYRLNQIQKYRGPEGLVKLDKLGGQTFSKSVRAARRATLELAVKLLDLYASRDAATRQALGPPDEDYHQFAASFPYDETEDQERAIDDVSADLEGERPMDRLVCGDVGFGKTEVALRAAFRVVMDGRQVAVLVPTTVLAQQHFQTFRDRFKPFPVHVQMLSRFRTAKQNREAVLGIKSGTLDIVIGTHRLLSRDVHFKRLGLLVVDEEHRFGVAHKERIRTLSASVDTLVLTATPIPRTLQMALGGIRDLSLIGTAPRERRPVRTMICHDNPEVLREAILRELARDGQVFFVHNRVRDIRRVASRVQQLAPNARVAVAHGQMKEERLEEVMLDFVAGRYDILVCTSIIESGLDISRVNTIIVDRADTFGMAQLYQLRGRVGRSKHQAYAYLVVPPLKMLSKEALERVQTLARHTELGSGFSVATTDLEIRGAGNLLGPEQSGNVSAVGFEMFCELLKEATETLRGKMPRREVEPELTFEQPGLIPEEYIEDVGQRLHFYKRLASAENEGEIEDIAAELVDRFGPVPKETEELFDAMKVKALSRVLGIRGVEVTSHRLLIHLTEESRVDPDAVRRIIREESGRVRLTSDLKIRIGLPRPGTHATIAAIQFLQRLVAYGNNPSIL